MGTSNGTALLPPSPRRLGDGALSNGSLASSLTPRGDEVRPVTTQVTVMLADGHPVVRGGLRALLAAAAGITVVAEAGNGREAVREAVLHRPDVLIMDLRIGDLAAASVIMQIRRAAPNTAVLVFTMADDDESVFTAMRAGARGYLLKRAEHDDLIRAVRAVAAGGAVFGAPIANRLSGLFTPSGPALDPFPELTTREREVLDLLAAGLPTPGIARRLCLAGKTVSNHLSSIFAKLQVATRAEAIVQARKAGLGRATA